MSLMTLANWRSENKTNMSGTIHQHSYGDIDRRPSMTRGFHVARAQALIWKTNGQISGSFMQAIAIGRICLRLIWIMNLKPLPFGIDAILSGEIWVVCGGVLRQSISLCKARHYVVQHKQGNKAWENPCVCQFIIVVEPRTPYNNTYGTCKLHLETF